MMAANWVVCLVGMWVAYLAVTKVVKSAERLAVHLVVSKADEKVD